MPARFLFRSFIAPAVLISVFAHAAAAQVSDPIQYSLYSGSHLEYGCFGPCACPVVTSGPMKGTFTFYRTSVDPLFTHYAMTNIRWDLAFTDSAAGAPRVVHVTGSGTYDLGGEVALTQRMTLDLSFDGSAPRHFDSGVVAERAAFPAIDVEAHSNTTSCMDSILHVVAAPPGFQSVEPGKGRRLLWSESPNPASGNVDMLLTPPVAGHARVEVVDVRGRVVASLLDGEVTPGEYRLRWNGRDAAGGESSPGMYWVRAQVGGRVDRRQIVRIK